MDKPQPQVPGYQAYVSHGANVNQKFKFILFTLIQSLIQNLKVRLVFNFCDKKERKKKYISQCSKLAVKRLPKTTKTFTWQQIF